MAADSSKDSMPFKPYSVNKRHLRDSLKSESPRALDIFRPCISSLRCKDETHAKALKQSSLRSLRCGGRVPRKMSNARFRDHDFQVTQRYLLMNHEPHYHSRDAARRQTNALNFSEGAPQ